MQSTSLINIAQFQELKALLEEDFVDLIKVYMNDSEIRLREMQEAYDSNDNRKGFEAAHSLKGASSNLGATQLTELCYELQEICRANTITQNLALVEAIKNQTLAVNTKINELLATP